MNGVAKHLVAITSVLLFSAAAHGEAFPTRPIQIVAPYPAGGVVDLVARFLGDALKDEFGQPVVILNQPGTGGVIGANAVAKSDPDGHTLLVISSAFSTFPALYPNLPFDPIKDFVAITPLAEAPHLLVVNQSVPANNVRELIALAKAEPGKLTYSYGGPATPSQLAGEMFKSLAGVDLLGIPYKSAPTQFFDVIAGRVSMSFIVINAALPYAKDQRIKIIGIGGSKRSPLLPQVPTLAESGVPGFDSSLWVGMFAPAKTPAWIVEKLNSAISRASKRKALIDLYLAAGLEPTTTSSAEFQKFFQNDIAKWGKVIKDAGIKLF